MAHDFQNFDNALLKDFGGYLLSIKGLSINTVNSYLYDLLVYFRYLKVRYAMVPDKLPFESITVEDVDTDLLSEITITDLYGFVSYTATHLRNTAFGRTRKISALGAFYDYMCDKRNLLPSNPILELERPRLQKRLPVYLSLEESIQLLKSIEGRNRVRDYAIITLFLNCGLRLSELTNIKMTDIKGDTLKVIGKGNKERTIYLNEASQAALKQYLEIRKQKKVHNVPYLFLSEQNNPISNRAVQHAVKKHIRAAKLDDSKISVHKLRHTAATLMYQYSDTDIRALQQILGHENIATTEIYTHIDDARLRDAVALNPLAHIQPPKTE
ncbi:MAG: tyrosine recombinase XerC [Eubacteriaceae bacterium]|jgi:site-specific recombinase XerD|nr:tyrosine recombinase XerC [Eubacteriaceae bacterium]